MIRASKPLNRLEHGGFGKVAKSASPGLPRGLDFNDLLQGRFLSRGLSVKTAAEWIIADLVEDAEQLSGALKHLAG